jgi:hypothetical protein
LGSPQWNAQSFGHFLIIWFIVFIVSEKSLVSAKFVNYAEGLVAEAVYFAVWVYLSGVRQLAAAWFSNSMV